jgi:hypothetical protein
MTVKQEFQNLVESQVAVWQGQLKDYQERMGQAGAEARSNYERGLTQLRENTEQAKKLASGLRSANESAWKDMQQASEKALEQLQQGWADALKRFG